MPAAAREQEMARKLTTTEIREAIWIAWGYCEGETEAETGETGDLSVVLSRTTMYSEFCRVDMDFLFTISENLCINFFYLIFDIRWN